MAAIVTLAIVGTTPSLVPRVVGVPPLPSCPMASRTTSLPGPSAIVVESGAKSTPEPSVTETVFGLSSAGGTVTFPSVAVPDRTTSAFVSSAPGDSVTGSEKKSSSVSPWAGVAEAPEKAAVTMVGNASDGVWLLPPHAARQASPTRTPAQRRGQRGGRGRGNRWYREGAVPIIAACRWEGLHQSTTCGQALQRRAR